MADSCSSCGAEIRWALSAKKRKRIPIDAEVYTGLDPRGALVLDAQEIGPPVARQAAPDDWGIREIHRSHFATCPHAATHRSKK